MQHKAKEILQWILAITIGFIIINCFCFLYERPVGWVDTPYGASLAVRRPGTLLVHGMEGYGLSKIDHNGFTNPNKKRSDSYLLIMGASHTQGKEIMPDKKYSVLVSDALSKGDNLLHAYNIACDGHFLPSLLQHFNYAIQTYPDASGIIIEIGSTDFSPEELDVDFTDNKHSFNMSASELFDSLTPIQKLKKQHIKEFFPFISIIKNKLETKVASSNGNHISDVEFHYSLDEYARVLNAALERCRKHWDKPIAFVYHPETKLDPNGCFTLEYSQTWELFSQICALNHIDIIDMGSAFTHHYKKNHELPYGFFNSSPGTGHLNAVGHQLIADEIISYWEEIQ